MDHQDKTTLELLKKPVVETGDDAARVSGGNWVAGAAQSIWKHEKATPGELRFMASNGGINEPAKVDAIKAQIADKAQDPENALVDAAKANRVVGFADLHIRRGAYFQFLIDEMPKLKEAGITDVAVEMPQPWQRALDGWTDVGQAQMLPQLTDGQSLLDVVDAAKNAGLKVTAVDEYYASTENGENSPTRDRAMADNIEQILQDKDKKVLYFVGAEHLASGNRRATMTPTTVQRLRDDNYSVGTFYQQLPSFPDGMIRSAKDLNRPISVDTKDADLLAPVRTVGFGQPPYGSFDNVIFYPAHYKMENCESELKQSGAVPPNALKADLETNRVILLGENKRLNPENGLSEHRKLFSQIMPELQKSGLTDFALNVPARYQSQLDDYANKKSGANSLDLPQPYDGSDFKAVLDAAIESGVKLHAIGQDIRTATSMKAVLDGLSNNLETISNNNNGGKTLFWGDDMFVAKFFSGIEEVSVGRSLNDAGIATKSVADFSQDFDKFSPSAITQLIDQPVLLKPEQTPALRTILNNERMQMDRFDRVIVYPSE